MTENSALLECRGFSKAFGAVQALYRVDFEVRRGEVMALVGDNGAGKTTLIKSIAGIYPFDEGELVFEGQPMTIHGPREAAQLGIEVVYQDLALADNLDVVGNMFLGRERVRNGFVLDESSMERSSRETLNSLSVTTLRSVRQRVAGLSGGQRQAVAVAKSVMWDSKLVILDEPTAALGVAQTRQVLDLVRRLAERQLGVVLVSHNLHDVFEAADRITVLRLGQRVAVLDRAKTTQQEVVHAITAGTLDHVPGMEAGRWRTHDRAGRPQRPPAVTADIEEPPTSRPPEGAGHTQETVRGGSQAGGRASRPVSSGRSRSSSGSQSSSSPSGCSTTRSSPSETSRTSCCRWRRSRRSRSGWSSSS